MGGEGDLWPFRRPNCNSGKAQTTKKPSSLLCCGVAGATIWGIVSVGAPSALADGPGHGAFQQPAGGPNVRGPSGDGSTQQPGTDANAALQGAGPGQSNDRGPGQGIGQDPAPGSAPGQAAAVTPKVIAGVPSAPAGAVTGGNGQGSGGGPLEHAPNATEPTRGPDGEPAAAAVHESGGTPAPQATAATAAATTQSSQNNQRAGAASPRSAPATVAPPSLPADPATSHRTGHPKTSGARPAPIPAPGTSRSSFSLHASSRHSARRTGVAPLVITPTAGAQSVGAGLLGPTAGLHATGSVSAPLAPGTAAIGPRSAAAVDRAGRPAHALRGQVHLKTILPPVGFLGSAGGDIIRVIPNAVWIALAAALALAAVAGATALRSGRRARLKTGEIAAATAAALTDPLTGLLNRRGFSEAADRELDRARRYRHPLALAFVDIRGLKAVNDTEGHLAGDRLLKQVSLLLRESARTNDVVGRIGGDELAVLLPEQSADGADAMIQRVRAQVPAYRASLGLTTPWDVTIGTSSSPEDGENFEELLAEADRRLYQQRGIDLAR